MAPETSTQAPARKSSPAISASSHASRSERNERRRWRDVALVVAAITKGGRACATEHHADNQRGGRQKQRSVTLPGAYPLRELPRGSHLVCRPLSPRRTGFTGSPRSSTRRNDRAVGAALGFS